MLMLAIACLFCGKCIERVSQGGSAIGYSQSGISVGDRRILRDRTSLQEEDDDVMTEIRNPITGGLRCESFSNKKQFGGENPALYEQYLDYDTSYYPHKRFPKANIGQVLATGK
jgi:hypothetical protein